MKKLGRKFISFDILNHLEGESWKDLKANAYEVGYDDLDEECQRNDRGYLTIWVGKSEKEISFLPSQNWLEGVYDNKARLKFYEKVKDALFYHYDMGRKAALQATRDYEDYENTVKYEFNLSRGV